MIPITLITGFLGSGKTTLLKEFIRRNKDRRFIYLINEFSPIDIDSELIKHGENDTISIPGGSIFCKCLVTQFIKHLNEIPENFSSDDKAIEGVIIEASGIADPRVIRKMLTETKLDEKYQLTSVISVNDPNSLHKLLKTLPNIKAQIESANYVILNKTDLVDSDKTEKSELQIKEINPAATIIKTTHCRDIPELFTPIESTVIDGDYAKCTDPNYAKLSISYKKELDFESFKKHLDKFKNDIFRVKGFITHQGEVKYIEYSTGVWSLSSSKSKTISDIVFIVNRRKELDINFHLLSYN